MTSLRSTVLAVAVLSLLGSNATLKANDDDKAPVSVTVSFGAGLNTGAPANHHVLPQTITVRMTQATATASAIPGVVNFVVGGFHQIFVYNPGVTLDDITAYLAANDPMNQKPFINDLDNLFYEGINPQVVVGGVVVNGNDNIPPANLVRPGLGNRTESVGFTAPGIYLVICNVRGHFQDGMIAFVKVVADDEDD